MNGRARIGLAGATACFWVAVGCLGISDVDESSPSSGGGGAGTGGTVGDGAWPDGPGGSGGADGGTGGTTNPTGGTGGTGVSGGTGGTGVSGGTGGAGGDGGTGATGGTGGVGGAPSWNVYSYNLSQGTWATPVALSTIWSGANAPPTSGIVAVTQLEHFDRLLVFADDGKYYVRVDGVWQAPVATTTMFPALAGLTLRSVYHVSSPPGTSPLGETITFVANPTAVLYKYNVTNAVSWLDTVTMKDEPLPGAPQGSGQALFDFEIRDVAKHGTADYYLFYVGYSNGNLYQLDAAAAWKSWPMSQSPFWSGKSNAPPTTGLVAAWTNAAIGRVYVVGP